MIRFCQCGDILEWGRESTCRACCEAGYIAFTKALEERKAFVQRQREAEFTGWAGCGSVA